MTGILMPIFVWKMPKGVMSWPVNPPPQFLIFVKFLLAEKCPKLGIQLPNAGDDNQSCRILTVLFNRTEQLHTMYYNIFSSTLIYTNVMIATSLQGGDHHHQDPTKVIHCKEYLYN